MDKELQNKLQKVVDEIRYNKPEYYIGTDTYDLNNSAYCLVRKVGDNLEFILSKTIKNYDSFREEINNLSKYFNAVIIEERSITYPEVQPMTSYKYEYIDFNNLKK